jgi:hypothetical protein
MASVSVLLCLVLATATLASVSHVHGAVDYTLKAKTVDLGNGLPPVMARELEQDIITALGKKIAGGKFGFATHFIRIRLLLRICSNNRRRDSQRKNQVAAS